MAFSTDPRSYELHQLHMQIATVRALLDELERAADPLALASALDEQVVEEFSRLGAQVVETAKKMALR